MKHIALNLQSEWLLQGIVKKSSHHVAEFSWHTPGKGRGDEIILQCILSKEDFEYLNRFKKDLELKNHVKVLMEAEYLGFDVAYSGQTPECAEHIVMIEASIKHIDMISVEPAWQKHRQSGMFAA